MYDLNDNLDEFNHDKKYFNLKLWKMVENMVGKTEMNFF